MPDVGHSLLILQGNAKRDPEGYVDDFEVQLRRYRACLEIFWLRPAQQSKDFSELISFLAQVASCYPKQLEAFPAELMQLLDTHFAVLDSSLRLVIVKALILMRNRGQLSAAVVFPFFIRTFRCPDKSLRSLIFRHLISDIKGSNQKHRNEQLNRAAQNMLFAAVADTNETAARRSLAVLVELWRRHVWRDARTVSVIASALFHPSMRIALPALKFFLGQDELAEGEADSDDEGGGAAGAETVAAPSRAEVYRATSKGTAASKKKKKAKLQRVMATVKRAARKGKTDQAQSFAAIQLLHDPQDLAEKLLARLQRSGGERWEAKLALLQVTSRIVGVHRLLLLSLYPLMQKYLQPHQRDVPALLAVLVQACHDLVPPDALQPVMRQLVDNFVHDRARPEVMTLGLRTVRELCARLPLVMTSELLQDLALYRKFREKEVASAARSLIALFREIAPGMLEKRDRGRGADASLAPKAYGASDAVERIPGAELLQAELAGGLAAGDSDWEDASDDGASAGDLNQEEDELSGEASGLEEATESGEEAADLSDGASASDADSADAQSTHEDDEDLEEEADSDAEVATASGSGSDADEEQEIAHSQADTQAAMPSTGKRREPQQPSADSLVGLRKQLAASHDAKRRKTEAHVPMTEQGELDQTGDMSALNPLEYSRFLTEDDFQRIRELRQEKLVEAAMAKHGLKSAAKRAKLLAAAQDEADEALEAQEERGMQGERRLDPSALQGKHKSRKDKEARLAAVRQGREGNVYGAAAGKKKQKTGGSSNKEKAKRKHMPTAARASKSAQRVASKFRPSGKNFKGRVKRPRK